MKKLTLAAAIAIASGCTGMNFYAGEDAALIPYPCNKPQTIDAAGKRYDVYAAIQSVDGSFTGSGQGCRSNFVYHIKPGAKRLRLIANFDNQTEPFIYFGDVEFAAELKPRTSYAIDAGYDGTTIRMRLSEMPSGAIVGQGETTNIRKSGKGNAAMQALPSIIK
jgi:hypothetical protein